MNEAQLVKAIKVCIEKGDKAKQKSDDFYIAAGQHLKTLKEASPSPAAFLKLVQEKIGLGKSRTSGAFARANAGALRSRLRPDLYRRER